LAMDIFFITKEWPKEERYALIDQIRRSTRSVCTNLKEAWSKRRYEAHFVSKLTDSDGENAETETWLDFAQDCQYITLQDYKKFKEECRRIGSMLGAMIKNPEPFLLKKNRP
jgi:four helix bundle protein